MGRPENWLMSRMDNSESEQLLFEEIRTIKRTNRFRVILTIIAVCICALIIWAILWDSKTRGTNGVFGEPYKTTERPVIKASEEEILL